MNAEETVAPDVPQSELVLRKLEDLLRSNQVTPQLEKETGMSREQMEQFVQKFKRAPKAPPGPGRQIEVKPGQAKTFDQNRSLPDLNLNRSIGTKSVRTRNQFAQDQERNMNEGERYEAPAEIQSRFEAYKSTLSRSRTVNPTRITPAQGAGGQ